MREFIRESALALGFARTYFTYCRGTVVLLVWAYTPYAETEPVPAYYINSNLAYHAAKALAAAIRERGCACERSEAVFARGCALDAGIGVLGRNGLLRIDPFGSRIVLETLVTDACAPEEYREPSRPCPPGCSACKTACPSGAINGAYDPERCMRSKMNNPLHPEQVRLIQTQYIGCEKCMFACPFNAALGTAEPPSQARAALDMRRLILGDCKEARALIGRNITSNGKLSAEAIAFAARDGLYPQEIKAAESAPFPAVREAALWARRYYGIK